MGVARHARALMRTVGTAAAAGVLIFAAAPGGGAVAQSTPARQTVRVLGLTTPLQVIVAQNHGWFAEYGVQVTTSLHPSSDALRRALADGSGDVAHAAVDNAVAMIENDGADVTIVLGGEGTENELIVQPDVRSIADLRGRTVLVDAPNTAYAIQLKMILQLNGLRAGRDYILQPLAATAQRLQAMRERKEYAASMLGPPTSLVAKRAGLKSLGAAQDFLGPYQGMGVFVTTRWAREHRSAVVAYLAAYIRAHDWLMDPANRRETLELMTAQFHLAPEVAEETYDCWFNRPGGYVRDAKFDVAGFENVLKLRAEIEGSWDGRPPAPSRYYDSSYFDAALAVLQRTRSTTR